MTDKPNTHLYIPAIDGLRAIAVAAVFLYHLRPGWLPSGFVGVDVFFVISGFVVCHSVLQMRRDQGFLEMCSQFYARRILRIAPALAVCLLVTGLASTLFIPQTWLSQVNNKTAIAAFFGLSNFVLFNSAGDYFSPRAESNPFTHTWSLAVEEQFYFVFPALIFGLAFVRSPAWRRVSGVAMVALVGTSLWLCAVWSQAEPAKAFYMLPARYWELGAGVLTCLAWHKWLSHAPKRGAQTTTQVLALAATAGLLSSLFVADARAFPYPWALLPVISTALLLAVLASADTWVGKAFTHSAFTWLGLRSYSIYLWHWPVFILFKWTVGLDDLPNAFAASALAIALGSLSYRLVENPVRRAPLIMQLTRPRVIAAGLTAVAGVALLTGAVFKLRTSISLSVTSDEKTWFPYEKSDPPPLAGQCAVKREEVSFEGGLLTTYTPVDCAKRPAGKVFVAGDSHATAYGVMLRHHAAETGSTVKVFNQPGCPFLNLLQLQSQQVPACEGFVKASLAAMAKEATPQDIVFLAALRVPRLVDQNGPALGTVSAALEAKQPDRSPAVDEAAYLLKPVVSTGARLVLEGPKPVMPSPTFRCADWFNRMNPVCKEGDSIPRETVLAYVSQAQAAVAKLSARLPRSSVWDPLELLCGPENCSAYLNGKPIIFDGDHLSGHANALLAPHFNAMVRKLQAPPLNAAQAPE